MQIRAMRNRASRGMTVHTLFRQRKSQKGIDVITVIPQLARFLIARICIARFFEGVQNNFHSTILYLSYTIK